MRLETFFEKFELFADAPGAVQRMRELILHLAVHGKLIDQCTDDEPASELLNRSRLEMARLMVSGQAKKEKPAEPVPEEDGTFSLPPGWAWGRLVDAAQFINGLAFKPSDWGVVGRPIIRIQNLSGRNPDFNRTTGSFDSSVLVQDGDILVSWSATLDAFIWRGEEGVLNQHIFRVLPAPLANKGYLYWLLKWVIRQLAESEHAHGLVMSHINRGPFLAHPIPIPPLAEQKRIVAKVDEVMALCDLLEVQQQERDIRHAALARASLARFAEAHTLANLDFLFHQSYPITPADLRKTILTLAVQGKLVPQNPSDGDARDVIDRAMTGRQQTIKTKRLRRKEFDESSDLIGREDLPSSWCVERLANLVDPENTISYGVLVPGNDVPDGIPFVRAQDLYLSNHPSRPNKTIAPDIEKPYARTRLTGGEILLCVVGSIGKLGIVPESWAGANIARAVARIKPIPEVLRDFLLLVLQEEAVQTYFTSTTRTLAQPTLNVGMIEQTPIPVPPLAEQRRIVAKVEQLMALVDQLETQLMTSRTAAEELMEAVVAELTAQRVEVEA